VPRKTKTKQTLREQTTKTTKNPEKGADKQEGKVAMGWLRSVGSIKLQVSFAKEPYKRDNIVCNRDL